MTLELTPKQVEITLMALELIQDRVRCSGGLSKDGIEALTTIITKLQEYDN